MQDGPTKQSLSVRRQLQTIHLSAQKRFHIVVLNHNRIELALSSFSKIRNFSCGKDLLVILDCSKNWRAQSDIFSDFCRSQRFTIGQDACFIRRSNYGIDQGGRLDYFLALHLISASKRPQYIWQFQDHYLDTTSSESRWPREIAGGAIKSDVISDDFALDLDSCQKTFVDQDVDVIYADRGKIRVFHGIEGDKWVYTAGGNFSVQTKSLLSAIQPWHLGYYRFLFNNTYQWALFMEAEWGRRFCKARLKWHDLVSKVSFDSLESLKTLEDKTGTPLSSTGFDTTYQNLHHGFSRPSLGSLAHTAISKFKRKKQV